MNMNLDAIGSISSYMKSLQLKTKVEHKKRTGTLGGHDDSVGNWMKEELKRKQENDKITKITNKVLAGKKLTIEERNYLREKNPQAYQQLVQSEQEQKAYEEELRHCETKDDVQRAKMNRVNAALSVIKSAEHSVGAEAAMGIAMAELAKLQAFERITQEFIESGEYAKLPTEAEKAEAVKEERGAEEARRTQEKEQPAESKEVEEKGSVEEEKPSDTEKPGLPKTESSVALQGTSKAEAKTEVHFADRKITGPDIETEAQRKVRHAKAKAAYAAVQKAEEQLPESMISAKA